MMRLPTLFYLLRVHNWTKNAFVCLPLVFSLHFVEIDYITKMLYGVLAFCFASSFIYIINDIRDVEADKLHPRKKLRPIASGKVSILLASIFAVVCFCAAISFSFLSNTAFQYTLAGYLCLQVAYNMGLKHVALLDCFMIAIGFVLRVLAGCYAIEVAPSDWIVSVTFFLALFLAFSKRKSELQLLANNPQSHRKSLEGYNLKSLDVFIQITAAISLVSYLLYTINAEVENTFQTKNLKYTSIFVVYGFFRYYYLSHADKNIDGDPTYVLIKDRQLQWVILLWMVSIVALIYGKNTVGSF